MMRPVESPAAFHDKTLPRRGLKRLSSVRCVAARTTLARARGWAEMAGISRVTDITRLDRLGTPVFASIRPRSQSSVATYGKGLIPIDAQVGAYMEAIEFFFAEPGNSPVVTRWGTPREMAGAERRPDAVLDFAPRFRQQIDLNGRMLLAEATEVDSGASSLVPAELVFHPAPAVGQAVFGATTNGLASGNSLQEASAHALAELIERDIWSFQQLRDTSQLVDAGSLPAVVGGVLERARRERLEFAVRYVANAYGLAFFSAFLFDPQRPTLNFLNGGWGCHSHKEIAVARAVCEAAQGRLAVIHGARKFPQGGTDVQARKTALLLLEQFRRRAFESRETIDYRDIANHSSQADLDQQWGLLVKRLRRVTDMPVYRVQFTPAHAALQVVRIIVPSLENYKHSMPRVGRRLKAAIDADD